MIGFFVNNLALRSNLEGNPSFLDFLAQLKSTTLEAYANQDAPFEKVVARVERERDPSRSPLFQVVFVLQNTPDVPVLQLGEAELRTFNYENDTCKHDLIFFLAETSDGLEVAIEYNTDLFLPESIERMMRHYQNLLSAIVAQPQQAISQLDLLTEEEKTVLLEQFNNTGRDFPLNSTLVDQFEEQAALFPNHTAVALNDRSITYKELNDKSNQLARYLRTKGVQEDTLVGICLDRSVEMIISVLGVLKSGGAYVPIDPEYPQDRINFILQDTNTSVVISSVNYRSLLNKKGDLETIFIDRNWEAIAKRDHRNLHTELKADHLAYVIYTSGSTGTPKGVMIEHSSAVNMALFHQERFQLTSEDRALQFTSLSFDVSVCEIFMTLLSGATLVLLDKDLIDAGDRFVAYLKEQKVSVAGIPTAYLNVLNVSELSFLRVLQTGGEVANVDQVVNCANFTSFYNAYGPTECTVCATSYKVEPSDAGKAQIPIGEPAANTSVFILDPHQQLVPINVEGELYIGGAGLARGYLFRKDLTAEKFVAHPFIEGERIYRTGDRARWLADGNIEFVGRMDDQVKIRGFRIELGEIESVVNEIDEVVTNCLVVKEDQQSFKNLINYYIPDPLYIKRKEVDFYKQQVNNWQDLNVGDHDEAIEVTDEEFNFTGWIDSFTGDHLSEIHMKEWLDDIIEVISRKESERVLEIGCGSGMIYYRLAPHIKKYIGFDLSQVDVNRIQARVEQNHKAYPETSLFVGAADQIELGEDQKVDTVVLNSVIQYFPGEKYLYDIIETSLDAIEGQGRVIIGDVRNNELQRYFKSRIYLDQFVESNNSKDLFYWNISQDMLNDKELCVSPEFFYSLQQKIPQLTHVDIEIKDGECVNEMILYRYNVVLHVGQKNEVIEPNWISSTEADYRKQVQDQIEKGEAVIGINGLQNPMLRREQGIKEALDTRAIKTVKAIASYANNELEEDASFQELRTLASAHGYQLRKLVNTDSLKMNVVLVKDNQAFIQNLYARTTKEQGALTNSPLFYEVVAHLQKEIRQSLQSKLPEYMTPAKFVPLMEMPLTPNGKVDRKFLRQYESSKNSGEVNYVAPVTPLQKELTAIWKDLLFVEKIGIYANFFELGGHSLLATRLASAIKKAFGKNITVKDIFSNNTIAELSKWLSGQSNDSSKQEIIIADRTTDLPLSYSQERLWFIDQLEGSSHYHMPAVFRFNGKIDLALLESSLRNILERHEILRTIYKDIEGQPFQKAIDCQNWQMEISSDCPDFHSDKLGDWIEGQLETPFNLAKDFMLRACLASQSEEEHLLVMTIHHIACDGWSMPILVDELCENYQAGTENREANLEPLKIQYADFAAWQRDYLQGELLDSKLTYWEKNLKGLENLNLPTDFQRPVQQSTNGDTLKFNINKTLSKQLQDLAQTEKSTLFMLLLSAFKILLYRYSGQKNICVGSPIANRTVSEVEPLIGFFLNTLALRSDLGGNPSFKELLGRVKKTTLDAYSNQDVPLEKIVERIGVDRDMSRSPLFQVLFVLQNNSDIPVQQLGESSFSAEPVSYKVSSFDLTFSATEKPNGIELEVEYCTDLFLPSTIERMIEHYMMLLSSIVINPLQRVNKLVMLTPEEVRQLLIDFNKTKTDYPLHRDIPELFEVQAEKYPENTAITFNGESISYQELDEKANQLAHYLISKGVEEETLVGLYFNRSIDMVIGLLGVLKSGGAYVPIDPDYPRERIDFILKDTDINIVVTQQQLTTAFDKEQNLELVALDQNEWQKEQAVSKPEVSLNSRNLSYVIYTSGSTGLPKGAMIEHRSAVNMALFHVDRFGITAEDHVLQFTSLSFDVSFCEIFMTLLTGAKLVLVDKATISDGEEFINYLEQNEVSVAGLPAAFLNIIELDRLAFLRVIMTGGEVANVSRAAHCASFSKFFNAYGPTECTVCASTYQVLPEDAERVQVPIGKPIANTEVYILDNNMQLLPPFAEGEICIGGVSLARGYLNQDYLTSKKFVPHPFKKGERLYRTGDRGKWLSDGNIDFLGRVDDQVKIRGYRVELGEIEIVLQQSELLSQCVVLAKDDANGNKQLLAYVVPEKDYDKKGILAYLKSMIPDYMIPAIIIELDTLPRNANDKIDKTALPEPSAAQLVTTEYVAPRNVIERKLVKIWKQLLPVDRIGVYDNFFELGGHSLLATRVGAMIRKQFHKELAIKTLFENPTIASLSNTIKRAAIQTELPVLTVQEKGDFIPLSFSQERLWFTNQLEGSTHYHMPMLFKLSGELNIPCLESAFQSIIEKHEILRSVYAEKNGRAYQQLIQNKKWSLSQNSEIIATDEDQYRNVILDLVDQPFDLSNDFMLRAHLLPISAQENLLLIITHHIASDGWSMSIFVNELIEFYQAQVENRKAVVKALEVQYTDYAIWQKNYLSGAVLDNKLQYWEQKLQGVEPLNIPTDFTRPAIQSTNGDIRHFNIDQEMTKQLRELAREKGVTLFMLLLAAFKVLLHRYTGQTDICVGSTIANRMQTEVESLIGFFVNTIALRSDLSDNPKFNDLLKTIKSTTLDAYTYQDVPFEKIVDKVEVSRDLSRSPIFQVMFESQNTPDVPELQLGDVKLSPKEFDYKIAKFDLTFDLMESKDELTFGVEYCTDLFQEDSIDQLFRHYLQLLKSILAAPNQSIENVNMLAKEEMELILGLSPTSSGEWFNKPIVEINNNDPINVRFENIVKKSEQQLAVIHGNNCWTYKQLNTFANQVAHTLMDSDVQPKTLVGVYLERTPELIAALMGILKCGAVYVPLDTQNPIDRIQTMIENSGITTLITRDGLLADLNLGSLEKIVLLDDQEKSKLSDSKTVKTLADLYAASTENPKNLNEVISWAYMLYTSGSTGQPKGAITRHDGAMNHILAEFEALDLKDGFRFLQSAGIGSDISVWQMLAPVLKSGTVVMVDKLDLLDFDQLITTLSEKEVSIVEFVPSYIWRLVDYVKNLKTFAGFSALEWIMMVGEEVPVKLVNEWKILFPEVRVLNGYGPCEASDDITQYEIVDLMAENSIRVPIGRPIANMNIVVLDKYGQLCPIGIAGELCVSGVGVGAGYWKMPEKTAERFIPNPFKDILGETLYKTGDLAKWLPDGNLVFLGRIDRQVKIRGHRVELGEIETFIRESAVITDVHVMVLKDEEQEDLLTAFVVAESLGDKKQNGQLKTFQHKIEQESIQRCKSGLPVYMQPARYCFVEEMPQNLSDKVDERKLRIIFNEYSFDTEKNTNQQECQTTTEEKLLQIWSSLLNRMQIGRNDDFFELGGHSLLAMRVKAAIAEELEINIDIKDLFIYKTISELAGQLDNQLENSTELPAIQPLAREGLLPLSFGQERLWFVDKFDGSTHYHSPEVYRIKGAVNQEHMEYALREIVNRHEVLRTVFVEEEGEAYQIILPQNQWQMSFSDFSNEQDNPVVETLINQEVETAFDLSKDHMLRAHLVQLAEEESILILVIHHIATDGWSDWVFNNELIELYEAAKENRKPILQPISIQYADYATWQREYLQGEVLQGKLDYWKEKLEGIEPLNIPVDFVRPTSQSIKGDSLSFKLDESLSQDLEDLSKKEGVTLYMLLVSAFKVLLHKYSGQEDLCVGTNVANRTQKEIESLVGFFVNSLALRSFVSNDASFTNFLQQVKTTVLDAYSHQDVPFEKVVDYVVKKRDLSRTPLFQVMFDLHSAMDTSALEFGELSLEAETFDYKISQFDLVVNVGKTKKGLELNIQYCSELFENSTAERFLKHYKEVLKSIVNNPNQLIQEINVLPEAEKDLLLSLHSSTSEIGFNKGKVDLGNTKTINQRFEEIALQYPKELAVYCGKEQWNYQRLNETANQIAHTLKDMSIQKGDFVGIYLDRDPYLIAGLLGIIKYGAVYVPLDTQNPVERIEGMIESSGMKGLITSSTLLGNLESINNRVVILADEADATLKENSKERGLSIKGAEEVNANGKENPANVNEMRSWAYMLYTSGSTGQPKGAITRHDGAMNHILAEYAALELKDGFRFLQSAGIGSDISVWQILAPLLKGGAVVIVNKFELLDYNQLLNTIEKDQISIVEFVPSFIWGFLDHIKSLKLIPRLPSLEWIMMVGEAVPVKLVNEWRNCFPHVRILNGYGPCEASDDITQYEIIGLLSDKLPRVPIGQPIHNMNIFITDSLGKLCPIGIPGEICVSGVGVGAGYWKLPQKTAESFIQNPFKDTLGDYVYKTGDLARWLPDGNLEFLGRIDRQVKIRGHRVELGEIESFIREEAFVKDAHLLINKSADKGEALISFVVPEETNGNDQTVLIGKSMRRQIEENLTAHLAAHPHLSEKTTELEKGIQLFEQNRSETLFAYDEIFKDLAYIQHGISLKPGAVVVDVGGNIGIFSMFISLHYPGSEIYAFEPLPPTFEIMEANCKVYSIHSKIKAYNAGLSDKRQEVVFQHYPQNTMLSGRYGDLESDRDYVRKVLEKQVEVGEDNSNANIDWLVDKAMEMEEYNCQLMTLSEIIEENNIEQIDLLKIDAERSEIDVMNGIKEEHWSKIQQLVIEVHEDGESLSLVKNMLTEKGFTYHVEQELLLKGTDLYNIYARRENQDEELTSTPELVGLDELQQTLRSKCGQGLPAYMQPTHYFFLEEMPLNLSDKVDENKLLACLEVGDAETNEVRSVVACETATEEAVLAIWQKLLDVQQISADDDFFEIGGHSLLAMRVKAAIRKTCDVELDIRDLFVHKTIQQIATHVDGKEKGNLLPKVSVQEREERIPISFAQERIWFIDQFQGSTQYHVQGLLRLPTELNIEALEFAFKMVLQRHEILRTVIREENGDAYQEVLSGENWKLDILKDATINNREDLEMVLADVLESPFDLSNDYMLRAQLIQLGEDGYELAIVMHHIASDGWSVDVVISELNELYGAYLENRPAQLPVLEVQYADFAIWQRKFLEGEVLTGQLDYWKTQLNNVSPLNLPTDFKRPEVQSTDGGSKHLLLSKELCERLKTFSKEGEVTLFMTLLSAFKILLYRYADQEDICVGTPVAGRTQEETESLVGFFINMLALRSNLSNNPSFTDLVKQVKDTTLAAYANQHVPFERIVDAVVDTRDLSRSPVFEVTFGLDNTSGSTDENDRSNNAFQFEYDAVEEKNALFDLDVDLEESEEGLKLTFQYCSKLFTASTIERMMKHYERVLETVVTNPAQRIDEIEMILEEEEALILGKKATSDGEWFNRPAEDLGNTKTINKRFEEIAETCSNQIAVVYGENQWTYRQLNNTANKIAHTLRAAGIQKGDFVGIYLERNPELVAGLLGIIKSGAAYVPLDTQNPAERVESMIESNGIKAIMTSCNLLEDLESIKDRPVLLIDECSSSLRKQWEQKGLIIKDKKEINEQTADNPEEVNDLQSWAYMLFTSGSTGQPKGAISRHDGALNHILAEYKALELKDDFRFLQSAGIGSDISVWQILAPLLKGGSVIIINKFDLLEYDVLIDQLEQNKINIVEFVPSYVWGLLDYINALDQAPSLKNLEWMMLSGEAAPVKLVNEWRRCFPETRILNGYGPCEASDDISQFEVIGFLPENAQQVSIGRPISNMNIVITNHSGKLCPIGIPGELCVSGIGVGAGYWNLPEKTAESFIDNPFDGTLGDRMYKTGDLARWLPNGLLEFLGRIDRQVKVRGHRVELGEIESFIREEESIKEVYVLVYTNKDKEEQLVSFITLEPELLRADEVIQQLRMKCNQAFPSYMQPAYYCVVDKMPVNLSDKIDERALIEYFETLDLRSLEGEREIRLATNETEERLVSVWLTLLNLTEVGTDEDFFSVGGHSLKAIQLVSAIYKQLDYKLTIREVFSHSTIMSQAMLVGGMKKTEYKSIPTVSPQPYYPASNAQKRLWVITQMDEELIAYNTFGAIKMTGDLNVELLEASIRQIVDRHEILRTTFTEVEGAPMQKINDLKNLGLVLEVLDHRTNVLTEEEVLLELKNRSETVMDIENGPLFRYVLYLLPDNTYYLFVLMHHIICDGWSNNIFLNEILELYNLLEKDKDATLENPLAIQYKDFASWQIAQADTEEFAGDQKFWLDTFAGEIPVLNFPAFKERPKVQTYSGQTINHKFSLEQLNSLKEWSKSSDSSLFMTITALLNVLFYKYTDQEDIVFGVATSGRVHPDLENQIGYYINTIALRNQIDPKESFGSFLEKVKQNTLQSFEHEQYPYDLLIKELNYNRDVSRNPLFDVLLTLQNMDQDEESLLSEHLDQMKVEPVELIESTSLFDMDFSFTEEEDGLMLSFTYNSDIYESVRMAEVVERMGRLIGRLKDNPTAQIAEINLLEQEEVDTILNQFGQNPFDNPEGETLASLFEAQAAKTPDKTALVFNEETITYKQLDEKTNQLAHYLLELGTQPDDLIAICLDRSPKMIIGILGILKAGAAYVPLDPSYPQARIDHVIEDTAARIVLTSSRNVEGSAFSPDQLFENYQDLTIVRINEETTIDLYLKTPVEVALTPENLAYLIYTSGSTGYPKGVEIEHRAIVNEISYLFQFFGLGENERVLQSGNFVFDLSVEQIFTSLLHGGTLVLIDKETLLDNQLLENIIEDQEITHLHATPSLLQTISVKSYSALKVVISGGEACSMDLARAWSQHVRFYNMYGPTEASIISTGFLFNEATNPDALLRMPIGKPVGNFKLYVLDKNFNPVPMGVIGELYVGGKGLARGYRNRPELTAEKFIASPFETSERLYRTGDQVRWLEDGNLEFHGRIDNQVKVNGQRIEIGGVESRIRQLEVIKDAVVIALEDQNAKKYLCGFIVLAEEEKQSVQVIKNLLAQEIPGYMVPRIIKTLDLIPMTTNGKADKKGLMAMIEDEQSNERVPYEAPQSEPEVLLAQAWEKVLKLKDISILENFYDNGGDSISAIQVASFMYKSGFKVDIKHIMQYGTIKELAPHVRVLKRIADQGPVKGHLPLTPIQISFFNQQLSAPHHFNQDMVISSTDRFEEIALEQTLQKIQELHDILRGRFELENGEVKAWIDEPDTSLAFEVIDLREATDAKERMTALATELQSSMNLETGPLMKTALFKLPDSDDLLISIHHLLIDEVSWRIFLDDFSAFYETFKRGEEFSMPLKTDSYKYWAEKLQEYSYSGKFRTEAKYWDKIAANPIQQIPFDFEASARKSLAKDYDDVYIKLSKEQTRLVLTEANQAFNTTINDLLLTAFGQATQNTFDVNAIRLSMESHGRTDLANNINIERTMGWFTCEYPVLLDLNEKDDLSKQIKIIKEHLHQIPSNGISYGILKYLLKREDLVDLENPQIVFNYLGQVEDHSSDSEETTAYQYYNGLGQNESMENEAKYPIEITAVVQNGELQVGCSYDRLRFKPSTIKEWMEAYQTSLEKLINFCTSKEDRELTPSDFDYKDLSIDDLEELETLFG